jgi:hypothetical protein
MGLMVEQMIKKNNKIIVGRMIDDFFKILDQNGIHAKKNTDHFPMEMKDDNHDAFVYISSYSTDQINDHLNSGHTSFDFRLNWHTYAAYDSSDNFENEYYDAIAERIVNHGKKCNLEIVYDKSKGISEVLYVKVDLEQISFNIYDFLKI